VKGFILSTTLVREEDKIVKILTPTEIFTLYRFYGARHSPIQRGNLIDFVIEKNPKGGIDRLRSPVQIPLLSPTLPLFLPLQWENFFQFLAFHFRGISTISPFYYRKLVAMGEELGVRPSLRVLVEGLFEIFQFEGILPPIGKCGRCGLPTGERVALEKNTLHWCHPDCLPSTPHFFSPALGELYLYRKTLLFSQGELEKLWFFLIGKGE